MKFGTTVLGAMVGGIAGAARGGKAVNYALWGAGIGFAASLLGVNATGGIAVGEDRREEDERHREQEERRRGGRRERHQGMRHAGMPGGQGGGCQCWANVDVFGNIQDHQTCYPTHQDAANRTNGFPGTPSDSQGGDHFTMVSC